VGELKRWISLFSFLFILAFIALFIASEKERLLELMVQELTARLETSSALAVKIDKVVWHFPLTIELIGVTARGDQFVLYIPRGTIQGSWSLLLGKGDTQPLRVHCDEIQLTSHQENLLAFLSSFPFSSLPPLVVTTPSLRLTEWKEMGALAVTMEKEKEGLCFQVRGGTWEAQAFLHERKDLSVRVHLLGKEAWWEGKLDFTESMVQGKGKWRDREFDFQGQLAWEDKKITFSPFSLASGGWVVRGEGTLDWQKEPGVNLRGEMVPKGGKESIAFRLQGKRSISCEEWNGVIEGALGGGKAQFQGAFSLREKDYTFTVKVESAAFAGFTGQGTIEGRWSDEKVMLSFPAFSVTLSGEEFPFQGEGILKGTVWLSPSGWEGQLVFDGEAFSWEQVHILTPHLEVEYRDARASFRGTGTLWGGNVSVRGAWQEGALNLQGEVQAFHLEEILASSSPVSGTLSGELVGVYDSANAFLTLTVTEGNLRWKEFDLGRIVGGTLTYRNGVIRGEGLRLEQGGGYIVGEVEREGERIGVHFRMESYPFSYSWGEKVIQASCDGSGYLEGGQDQWKVGMSMQSSWELGETTKGIFALQGVWQDDTLAIEKLWCDWGEGKIDVHGRVKLYEEVDLQGSITHLVLPPNGWDWSGELHSLDFVLTGPWNGAAFSFQAQGSNFAFRGEPMGEGLTVKMSGRLPLPQSFGEGISWTTLFHPRFFEEGEIRVKGMNLSSLFGIDFLRRYEGEGRSDLILTLDPHRGRWRFFTENLSLTLLGDFTWHGTVEGWYDGETLTVNELTLSDTKNYSTLTGQGKIALGDEKLDLRLQGVVNGVFPWKEREWFISGKGEGSLVVGGTMKIPTFSGEFLLEQGEIQKGGKTLFRWGDIHARWENEALTVLSGWGEVGNLTAHFGGMLSSENVHLQATLRGKDIIPGWEAVFRGEWEGTATLVGKWDALTLQGKLALRDGVLDLSGKHSSSPFSGENFQEEMQKIFAPFPLAVKLDLETGDTLRVKTRFLDLELKGALHGALEGENLTVEGKLEVVRGEYDLIFCQFPLQGSIFFGDLFPLEPQLALEGEKEVNGYRIRLAVRGPLKDYTMTLTSEPSLSQEQILSLLFLGNEDAYLSLDTLNLTPLLWKGLQFLWGKKGGNLENMPFFDRLELDLANFSRLTVEKRLGKNISFGYTQKLKEEEESSLHFAIDFSREWSFKGEVTSSGETEWWLEFKTRF